MKFVACWYTRSTFASWMSESEDAVGDRLKVLADDVLDRPVTSARDETKFELDDVRILATSGVFDIRQIV